MAYLIVKWLHILSSTVLFGTGIGSAFWMFVANRSRSLPAIVFACRTVVLADWLFTTPAVIFQPLSGLYMVHAAGYHLGAPWLVAALVLYVLAGLCWLPVVWIQIRMKRLAEAALDEDLPLPALYWTYDRWWIGLGCLAFPAVVVIFWLMVFTPG
ncbi:DUF2269 family protein [Asticcacaulis solisilvae]|uniref:DUF2269 family protein n=1 Tax=Asticcacaulis solisilvae TaxID=1217274 RepID=UPI003FD89242